MDKDRQRLVNSYFKLRDWAIDQDLKGHHEVYDKFKETYMYIDGNPNRPRSMESQLRMFKEDYDITKSRIDDTNILRQMKYDLRYETDYKTALQFKKAAESAGINIKLSDVKSTSTQELVSSYYDEIKASFKGSFFTGKLEAFITLNWFGSK